MALVESQGNYRGPNFGRLKRLEQNAAAETGVHRVWAYRGIWERIADECRLTRRPGDGR
jgi:hypothetical protein